MTNQPRVERWRAEVAAALRRYAVLPGRAAPTFREALLARAADEQRLRVTIEMAVTGSAILRPDGVPTESFNRYNTNSYPAEALMAAADQLAQAHRGFAETMKFLGHTKEAEALRSSSNSLDDARSDWVRANCVVGAYESAAKKCGLDPSVPSAIIKFEETLAADAGASVAD